jgi:threonine dehydrogenase-like Zn-dependent dehydrogenase
VKGVVFVGDRRCECRDVPMPEPDVGEVQIRIIATGICGSDLSVYRAGEGRGVPGGHEASGVVAKVGANVERIRAGDRVSSHHHLGCGACAACAHGEFVACPGHRVLGVGVSGSFAEYTVVPERCCVVLPASASFVDGAFMGCVGTTAYAALRRLEPSAHETLVVFGLGPVGLSCVLVAKSLGLRVLGVDVRARRLELAKTCGADDTIDASSRQAGDRIAAFGSGGGVDYAIETSGSAPARRLLIPSVRRGGKIAIVGVGSDEEVVNPSQIHGKALVMLGSVVFPMGWMWDMARHIAASGLTFEPAVTHRFALDDCSEALRVADQCEGGKVIFLPHGIQP